MTAATLLAGALLIAAPASAEKGAGAASIVHLNGKATIRAASGDRPAAEGERLSSGDRVTTTKDASAVIELPDGSRLKLRGSTSVLVDLPDGGSEGYGARLDFGGVFARVTKRLAGQEFRVRTKTAVASVRGTQFFTAFGREGAKGQDLWVCVKEGAVDVGTDASKEALPVPAGKGVLIKSGLDLTKPQAYEWTKKLNWNMDAGRGGVEDRTNLDGAYSDLLDQDYR